MQRTNLPYKDSLSHCERVTLMALQGNNCVRRGIGKRRLQGHKRASHRKDTTWIVYQHESHTHCEDKSKIQSVPLDNISQLVRHSCSSIQVLYPPPLPDIPVPVKDLFIGMPRPTVCESCY